MALNEIQQIKQILQDKKHVLIVFRQNSTNDTIASAVGLSLFLEKMKKQVDIISAGFVLPKSLKFLSKAEEIKSNFAFLQKFILTVDIKQTGLQELSYDLKDEKLRIFITPQNGFLTRDNIRTAQLDFKYEIIFVIDTPDLESLGSIHDNNTELFYKRPIINLDHNLSNEHFGQINFIESTATSTAEVVFNFIHELGNEYLDEQIATALLTGIIANTHSFKTADIKPQTLNIASKLISLGANRDNIVQNLYRTKSISTLKLWGTALSHLQHDPAIGLTSTTITRDDFVRSGAQPNELYEIVDELLSTSPEVKIFALFHEQTNEKGQDSIHIILDVNKKFDARTLLIPFGQVIGDKKQASVMITGKSLKEVEEEVILHIKKTAV